jgi:Rhodopirellula transposase DDE domain
VSVETKKKELVGSSANGGRERQTSGEPEWVNVPDFPDPALGKAIPYGSTILGAIVSASVSGQTTTPRRSRSRRCRAGGSRSAGSPTPRLSSSWSVRMLAGPTLPGQAWKTELARLAGETGLQITVCHLPSGTSWWNRTEHRLFSAISMNWRGRPLISHEVIVELIRAARTPHRLAGPGGAGPRPLPRWGSRCMTRSCGGAAGAA